MGKRKQDEYDKKIYVAFYMSKRDLARIDSIIGRGDTLFEDRSTIIRYCIKQYLPRIEEELGKSGV